jgi:hypothetical protein
MLYFNDKNLKLAEKSLNFLVLNATLTWLIPFTAWRATHGF